MVRLSVSSSLAIDYSGIDYYCSGIVLEPKRILTTADCVSETEFLIPGIKPEIPFKPEVDFAHEILDDEIGGTTTAPPGQPLLTPNIKVTDVFIHPENEISLANLHALEHDLAILYLEKEVAVFPATLYDGEIKFSEDEAQALGWIEEIRIENAVNTYYNILRKTQLSISDSSSYLTHLLADNIPPPIILSGRNLGSPVYKLINNRNLVIGLFTGLTLNNLRAYSNINSMISIIKQHAPNTQFWNESSSVISQSPISIFPLLLLE